MKEYEVEVTATVTRTYVVVAEDASDALDTAEGLLLEDLLEVHDEAEISSSEVIEYE